MFAKLENNTIRPAPKKVSYNGGTIFNPPGDVLLALGYLPVTYTDMPTDAPAGQHYESTWSQTDTEIVQVWQLEEDPKLPEPEPTMSDLAEAVERGITT